MSHLRLVNGPLTEILAERNRQIEVEGYDSEHDDRLFSEALMDAALCYEAQAAGTLVLGSNGLPRSWPFPAEAWKPSQDPRRDLVRAGALCLAEQDRWERDGMCRQVLPDLVLDRCIAALQRLDAAA